LVCHIRGEGDLLYDSVSEVLGVAKRLQVPLHISHFKCIGRANWGHLLARTIALIEAARDAGQKVDVDVYPWTAGSTQMVCL
jgi:N-acyl-D-aspartate/D-glutamate deacylase